MSIPTVNSVTTGHPADNLTDVAVAHTVAPGLVDAVMVVLVQSPSFAEALSADWNGVSMTKLSIGASSDFWCSAFYLRRPSAGAFNANVHWGVIEREACITILTIEGAGIPEYLGGENSTGSSSSFTGATTKDDALVLDFIMSALTPHTQGAGQTEESNFISNTGNYRQSVSIKGVASVGSVTMGVTFGGSKDHQMKVLQFAPPISSPGNMFLVF